MRRTAGKEADAEELGSQRRYVEIKRRVEKRHEFEAGFNVHSLAVDEHANLVYKSPLDPLQLKGIAQTVDGNHEVDDNVKRRAH